MSVKAISLNVIFSFLIPLGVMGCSASTQTQTPTQVSENLPSDCPTYVLTSTEHPKRIYLSTEMGAAPLFNPYDIEAVETYASSRGEDCSHVKRHLATMDNYGKPFGGVILTGKPYTHVLQESEYPLDLTMEEANVRGAFYDKFEGAVTFHFPVGTTYSPVTEDRNVFFDKVIDYDRFCTELGILFSVWSDFNVKPVLDLKDSDVRDTKAVIRELLKCDGGWKYFVKSKSSEPDQRETARELFVTGLFRSYYSQTDKEQLLANREGLPTPSNCPSALQIFSKEGLCLEYFPPVQNVSE